METKSKSISLKAILIFIALGIWTNVLQNAGFIPLSQKVVVTNDVGVYGTVDVEEIKNTVDVDITRINGSGTFYDHGGDGHYNRLPVYTGN